LSANSGNNATSFNTGGDSSITTGNANVNANVLTFANNNIAGNVLYNVVNVFGNLVGDIILPQSTIDALFCGCNGNNTASNSGNGAGSNNTANSSTTNNSTTGQANDANINNNLTFNATTGSNDSNFNTDGSSTVKTGASNVSADVLNVANMNLTGGQYWLVIINDAGHWIGEIMGAPDGSNVSGSPLLTFAIDPTTGAVSATNQGNGAGSTNNTNNSTSNSSSTTQSNTANIQNNVNLSANTGGNNASENTGGNSNITTGDANIVANVVNFVNNNITGGAKLVVTVVNVFGSWLGNFVGPGQADPNDPVHLAQNPQMGGAPSNNNNSNNNSTGNQTTQNVTTTSSSTTGEASSGTTGGVNIETGGSIQGVSVENAGGINLFAGLTTNPKISGSIMGIKNIAKGITINLAWFVLALPILGFVVFKRKLKYLRGVVAKGVSLLL